MNRYPEDSPGNDESRTGASFVAPSTRRWALDDRVAVVTGACGKLGPIWVRALLETGAQVAALDLERVEPSGPYTDIAERYPQRLQRFHVDVTSRASLVATREAVEERFGPVSIVVNNAGIDQPPGTPSQSFALEEIPEEVCRQVLEVNLVGLFLTTQVFLPSIKASGGGSVINIGSIEGFAANPGHTAYSASKGGVHGLTVALAVDLGPDGVRCNAIAPGWIDTELNAHYLDRHPRREEAVAALARLHPVGHIGSPGDVGDVAVWLASDESRFVTGQVITVDGGRTARPSLPEALEQ